MVFTFSLRWLFAFSKERTCCERVLTLSSSSNRAFCTVEHNNCEEKKVKTSLFITILQWIHLNYHQKYKEHLIKCTYVTDWDPFKHWTVKLSIIYIWVICLKVNLDLYSAIFSTDFFPLHWLLNEIHIWSYSISHNSWSYLMLVSDLICVWNIYDVATDRSAVFVTGFPSEKSNERILLACWQPVTTTCTFSAHTTECNNDNNKNRFMDFFFWL